MADKKIKPDFCNILRPIIYNVSENGNRYGIMPLRTEVGTMRRGRHKAKGALALTFACGLLISCFCPPKLLVAVLALWVIILGISDCRC